MLSCPLVLHGHLTYIAGYEPLANMWYSRELLNLTGHDGDMWDAIRELMKERLHQTVIVFSTHRHWNAQDILDGKSSTGLVLANTVADEMADWMAKQIRVPEGIRHLIRIHERRARFARLCMLRATKDCMAKEAEVSAAKRLEKRGGGAAVLPPPPPPLSSFCCCSRPTHVPPPAS